MSAAASTMVHVHVRRRRRLLLSEMVDMRSGVVMVRARARALRVVRWQGLIAAVVMVDADAQVGAGNVVVAGRRRLHGHGLVLVESEGVMKR